MLLTILCTFRPGALAEAKRRRLEHYEFLRRERTPIVEGGPLTDPEGVPTAMLMVVDRDSEHAARAWIAQEPYNAAGLFESVAVRQWHRVIPEPESDYIEHQYESERAARATA